MVYPEPRVNVTPRFENFFRKTAQLFTADKEVIICTTHGDGIAATTILAGIPDGSQLIFDINYGSTTILKLEDGEANTWTTVGNFSVSKHLGLNDGQMIPA